ncbi:two-component regulator propeller domain-containing protein [Flectobacillus major]|uniref:two-component regulator propeller domain-containing protein n=1 Tax=Flectobacillus major TaxID=103 RepID=UPI00047C2B2D|nr:two-component regulator propeller domain-containing protein [Flectobacillus major]
MNRGQFLASRERFRYLRGRLFYLWILASLFLLSEAAGQSVSSICNPEIISFTKQQYGAHYQNWDVVQDQQTGFMYFANSKGLLEYDGSNWKVYELPQKQIVRSLAVDGQGRIYTGALGSIGYWQANTQGLLQYHSIAELIKEKEFFKEEIWHIIPYKNGVMFQSFAFLYIYENGKVTRLKNPGTILFVSEAHQRLLVQVIGKGIFEIIHQQFVLIKGSEIFANEAVNVVLPHGSKDFLICASKGLYLYDGQNFKSLNTSTNAFLQHFQLNRGILLKNGQYLFGTILNGVILTDAQGNIIRHINQKNGLQNNTVLSLLEDQNQNVWVGLDKGIDLLVLSSPLTYYRDLEGYFGTVYDVATVNDWFYVGTNQGVFCKKLSDKNARFRLVPKTQGQVWDLAYIDNQLLCGHNNGTFLLEGDRATQLSSITGGWMIKKLRNHPDWLIQGTYTKLCMYKKTASGQWRFDHVLDGFTGSAKQLEEDSEGNIWVNRPSIGLAKITLDKSLKKVASLVVFEQAEFKDAGNNLTFFQNQILVSTPQGLQSYDIAKQRFNLSDTLQKWLFGDIIHKFFPVSASEAYILRKDGTLQYGKIGHKPIDIPINNNRWVDSYENVVALPTGELIVCTEDGFANLPNIRQLSQYSTNAIKPFVRSVTSLDAPIAHIFRKPPQNEQIELDYDQNNINVVFSTTNFTTKVKYSYWLENAMKIWSPFQYITQKEFSNLLPGRYIFHLKSNQNDQENTVTITILPPWYWNNWSKAVYVLIFIGLNVLFYRWQDKRFKLKQLKERRKLEKRLRRQEELSQNEIMQLRNEQLEKDIIRKSEELANSTMVVIKKNELLLEIKQEVDNLRKELGGRGGTHAYKQILHLIDSNISTEQDWQIFESNFNMVHEEFLKKLIDHYPNLTPSDLKLAAYLRMNLSTKEIAQLFNITNRSVELKRYRLRKKMDLDTEVNLGEFMMKY